MAVAFGRAEPVPTPRLERARSDKRDGWATRRYFETDPRKAGPFVRPRLQRGSSPSIRTRTRRRPVRRPRPAWTTPARVGARTRSQAATRGQPLPSELVRRHRLSPVPGGQVASSLSSEYMGLSGHRNWTPLAEMRAGWVMSCSPTQARDRSSSDRLSSGSGSRTRCWPRDTMTHRRSAGSSMI